MKNMAGVEMKPGTDGVTYYCGRRMGKDIIPHSDGRCGPSNGPQCPDCRIVMPPRIPNHPGDWQPFPSSMLFRQNAEIHKAPIRYNQKIDNGTIAEDLAVPQELVSVPLELTKQFTFCVTGNQKSLETLLNLLSHGLDGSVFDLLL